MLDTVGGVVDHNEVNYALVSLDVSSKTEPLPHQSLSAWRQSSASVAPSPIVIR